MLVLPLAAGLIHMLVPFSGAWSEVMVLTACAGTIFGAPAFAQLTGADARLVLLGVLASTLLMPLVLPVVALWTLGGSAEFDFYTYGLRLFVFLVVPAVIAGLYHGLTGPARRSRHAGFLRLGSVFFLSLFAVAVMDGVGQRLAAQTQAVLELLLLAFGIHIVFFGSALAVFSAIDTRTALTAGILCGYRNLGLLLAVAGALLPPDFILFVALWQIPMYVMPLLIRRLLGPAP
jgi:BASS family bile acid:Na+ symporter